MLNELALIRNGLGDEYIQTVHKHLAESGKNNVLRVLLSSDPTNDRIDDLHCIQGEEHKNYWTQGIGNKNQFPAVKLPFPLRPSGVGAYESWKKDCKSPSPQQRLDCLEKLRNVHPIDISKHQDWPDYRQKLIERMEIYKNLQGDATIVHSLLATFLAIENNGSAFLAELDEKLWKQCQCLARKEILNIAALILFAGGQSLIEGFISHGKRPTLLFDLNKGHLYSAAHKYWKIHISSALYTYEEREGNNKLRYGTCAISGDAGVSLVADTFPSPKCKHLGNITLFSRKAKVFTYERYRKGAAHSMTVSKALADELAGALDYLNQSEKKGKTWDILPSETGKGDLLLAFCRSMPDVEPIRLLTPDADRLEETEYELEASQICKSFRGKNPDLTIEPRVDFLIIRKISDGVQKAIFSSSQTLSNLTAAADNWVQASNNLPSIELMFCEKGEKSPRFKSPRTIYPQQFAILFKKHYNRDIVDGKHPAVPGLPFSETMALFLNENCGVDLLSRLLNRLIRQFANLLEQGALKKTKRPILHKDAHHALSAMGLLLFKLDRTKEVYMNELAYKLGQFCAALDEIHIGYCYSQRKGQKPERLIGNKAYSIAVVNPLKALAITAQRSAVYLAWAEKLNLESEADKNIKNAKFAYIWLQKHSSELHQLIPYEIPTATPTSKAELLLGYLSGRPITKREASIVQTIKTEGDKPYATK